jgi:hypothetical protein
VDALGTTLVTLAALLLIGLAVRDISDALFHPEGARHARPAPARGVCRGFRAWGRGQHVSPLAGPLALVVVIGTWARVLILR